VAVAAVHIISPAGAFLSSPYSEALFSCLNILGFQLYLDGLRNHYRRRNPRADIQCLAAGAVFGFATSVRSNGLLSGSLFFYDATVTAISLVNGNFSIEKFRRLIVVGIGGCLTALGVIVAQYRAYASYCILEIGSETRPWCDDYVPSIYAWVQGHYWYEDCTLLVTSDH
jgi:GPI mannosyltransferase 2